MIHWANVMQTQCNGLSSVSSSCFSLSHRKKQRKPGELQNEFNGTAFVPLTVPLSADEPSILRFSYDLQLHRIVASIFLRDTLMLPTSRRQRQWANDDHNGRLLAVQQMRMPIFRLFCNTVNVICTVCRRRLFHFQINMPPNLIGYWVNRALLS